MKTFRWVTTTLFVIALLLTACSPQQVPTEPAAVGQATQPQAPATQPPAAAAAPKAGGSFVWASEQEPDTLDWQKSGLIASYNVDTYLSAALVQLTQDNKLVPWLAESYKISDDGLTYDFNLRQDVKFHDGSPLTAKDYVWTFKRALDEKTASPVAGSLLGPVQDVTETGPYSFSIKLKSAYAPLLFNLADPGYMGPISQAAFEKMGETAFGRAPIGVGPFKIKEWKTGERIILERNPDYQWGSSATKNQGPANIETLEFRIIPEYSTVVAGLQANEVQFAKLQTKDVENIQSLGKYDILTQPAKGLAPYVSLNVSKPPFDDLKVRQAFNLALNRQGLIDVVLQGKGEKQFGPLSPPQIGYWDGAQDIGYDYDLAKAKQLMQEAGYTLNSNNILEKNGQPLTLKLMVFSSNELNVKTSQVIQQQLKELGVDATIEQVEPGVGFKRLMDGDYEACVVKVTAPEADIMYLMFDSQGSLNLGHLADSELDALLEKSRTINDPAERQKVLDDIQKMIIDKAYIVPLFVPQDYYALDNQVTGGGLTFFDTLNMADASFK